MAPHVARGKIVGPSVQRVATEEEMKASLAQVELVDEAGARLSLAAVLRNGRPTLVSLWAHRRPNCMAEMAGFKAIAKACPQNWNIVFVSSRTGG